MAKERRHREEEGSGFLGKLIALLLGFILGIAAIVGGVAGVGYYALQNTINSTLNLVNPAGTIANKLFSGEYPLLNPDYAEKLLGDLLKDGIETVNSVKDGGPLSDVAEISPAVNKVVDKMLTTTDKYSIPLDRDELLANPIEGVFPYIEDSLKETPLGGLLQGFNGTALDDPILISLCYGSPTHYTKEVDEKGETVYVMNQVYFTYEDKDLTDEDSTKRMYDANGVLVDATYDGTKILTFTDGKTGPYYLQLDTTRTEKETYLAFEDEDLTIPVKYPYTKISDLTSDTSALVDGLYLCDAMGLKKVTDGHDVLISLAYGEKDVDYTVKEDDTIEPINPPRTIGELKKNNEDIIDGILLKDALSVTASSHPVMISLAYGTEGTDYTIVDGEINPITPPRSLGDFTANSDDIIKGIHLSDIMSPDTSSSLNMYLLYGKKNIHYQLDADNNPVMLQKRIAIFETTAYNEYGEKIEGGIVNSGDMEYTSPEGVPYKYAALPADPTLVHEVKTTDGKIATLYLLNNLDNSSVGNYEPMTLGSFSGSDNLVANMNTRLTLGEILGESATDENIFLKHVSGETIQSLPDAINNLAITEVYEDKVFDTNNDGTYSDEEKVAHVPSRTWWYLLHNEEECHKNHCHGGGTCPDRATCLNVPSCGKNCVEPYTVEDFGTLITNMTANMQIATLNQLDEDGMIDLTPATLDTDIMRGISVSALHIDIPIAGAPTGKNKLGELTVSEMLTYVGSVLSAVTDLQNRLNGTP